MSLSVVLVRPPSVVPRFSLVSHVTPPLGLAYIAGSVQAAGIAVRCVDAQGEAPFQKALLAGASDFVATGLSTSEIVQRVGTCDVIGISVMFSHEWTAGRSLIQALKEALPQAKIVAGGEHVSAIPEFCLQNCPQLDYCVIGEGEETMVELLRMLEASGDPQSVAGIAYRKDSVPRRTNPRGRLSKLEEIPWPAWDLFPLENYLQHGLNLGINPGRTVPVLASRGCPYQCTFCSSPQMWGTRWQARAPQDLVAEIEHLMNRYQANNFELFDLTAILRRDWIVEFCQLIIERRLDITWQLPGGTRSEALDAEVLRLLYQSGSRDVCYAPESGSERTLKLIKKKVHLDRMKQSMRHAIDIGINIKLNMIIGFPHETVQDVWRTMMFLKDMALMGVGDIFITCFVAYPGSELFGQLYREGRITLNDAYFLQLSGNDMRRTASYSPHLPARGLAAARLGGMLWFYGLSYATRPQRVVQLLQDLWRGNDSNRMSKFVRRLVARQSAS